MILHLDGDAFFVSVEAAKDPSLRGVPAVTGEERGIASAVSYEAKALGITRAMPVFRIRREFPQVRVVKSDYRSYAIFSRRMMDIVRRYADVVEEYSIDECFAEFGATADGVAAKESESLRPILARIKSEIRRELGISVSLGVGPTKVLAKTASKSRKPDGLVVLGPEDREPLLDRTPVRKVWGIGSATAAALGKRGIRTALELARMPLGTVEAAFSKPVLEIWHELNGRSVWRVGAGSSEAQRSIMKTRTFAPATNDPDALFSELSKNIENACRRSRELGLAAQEASIHLKTREFAYVHASIRLGAPSDDPREILRAVRPLFRNIARRDRMYRATGVVLSRLISTDFCARTLFGAVTAGDDAVLETIDRLNERYGRAVVRLASSERAFRRESRSSTHSLRIPYLGILR